jgi:hypothetical protein
MLLIGSEALTETEPKTQLLTEKRCSEVRFSRVFIMKINQLKALFVGVLFFIADFADFRWISLMGIMGRGVFCIFRPFYSTCFPTFSYASFFYYTLDFYMATVHIRYG